MTQVIGSFFIFPQYIFSYLRNNVYLCTPNRICDKTEMIMKKRQLIALACTTFLMALLFVLINSKSTSPLFCNRFIDSDIFRYMGYAILQGKIPYTDLFDHKGLLLYFINALGLVIHSNYGIFFIQVIHLTATLIVWYKMLSNYQQTWQKYLILAVSLIGLWAYYEEGNLAEEWSLFCISLPIMLWLDTLNKETEEFSIRSMFAIGLCMGAIFLLRINNMVPAFIILLYCLIEALLKRKYSYAVKATGIIFASFLIFPLLACLYMYLLNGTKGVDDMFYAIIGFNLDYAKESGIGCQFDWSNLLLYSTPFLPILYLLPFILKKRQIVIPLLLATLFTFISIGGRSYPHYFIVFIPLLAASFACLPHYRIKYPVMLVLVLLNVTQIRRSWITYLPMAQNDTFHESFCEVIKPIPDAKKTQIWNMAGGFLARDFIESGLIQQNRMLLPFQLGVSERLFQEEGEKIQEVKPEYVIYAVYTDEFDNSLLKYTVQNNYKESDSDYQFLVDNYDLISSVKREDDSMLYCYRIKQNADSAQTDNN